MFKIGIKYICDECGFSKKKEKKVTYLFVQITIFVYLCLNK